MAKFNVGDLVIGKANNRYVVTREGYIGKVLAIYDDERFVIGTRSGTGGETTVSIDGIEHGGYIVKFDGFDLYKENGEYTEREYNKAIYNGCPFVEGDTVKFIVSNPYGYNKRVYIKILDSDGTVYIVNKKNDRYGEWVQWRYLRFADAQITTKKAEEDKTVVCDICGCVIEIDDEYFEFDGKTLCHDCKDEKVAYCEDCGEPMWVEDSVEFDGNVWCEWCYDTNTAICECCDERFLREDMTRTGNGDLVCEDCLGDNYTLCEHCGEYYPDGDMCYDRWDNAYCESCYEDRNSGVIENYYYKPTPIFYGDAPDNMYMGVEVEMDGGGEDGDNAEALMDIANDTAEHIYIKHDGSLDEGFEIVSHPATLEYHTKNIQWQRLMTKALSMEYRSHDTSTCGLHCHISRKALGDTYAEQEDTISKIIYFIELHWAEILKFSRRSEYAMSRWAARYGIESDCRKTYEKAKGNGNRYHCINLENEHTVEFRMFRGTLRYNTFIATLQFVDEICRTCIELLDTDIESQAWSDFVANIDKDKKPELITYLKERNLYVNDAVECDEEEM